MAHGRDPSVFDGDGLVDTPPDPGVEELSCASTDTVTLSGVTFTLPRTNVMSCFYARSKSITQQQIAIVRATLAARAHQGLVVTSGYTFP